MRRYWPPIKRFLSGEGGPTAVEYAIVLMLIFLACLGAIRTFGTTTQQSISNSAQSIGS